MLMLVVVVVLLNSCYFCSLLIGFYCFLWLVDSCCWLLLVVVVGVDVEVVNDVFACF